MSTVAGTARHRLKHAIVGGRSVNTHPFDRLVNVMATLRGAEGCPWDREQDHDTLKKYLIEETYELIDAIDSKCDDALTDELGDVLLQIIFHSQIASETNRFSIVDVIENLLKKLIRRHPHVFLENGPTDVKTGTDVHKLWDEIKNEEQKGGKLPKRTSVMDGVPRALPALMLAHEIQKKAAQVGFDWADSKGALEKVIEEVQEVRQATESKDIDHLTEEWGDLFFSLINVARLANINPEDATRQAANKFERRFRAMEKSVLKDGLSLDELTLEEMDVLWEAEKRAEAGSPARQRGI